MNVLSGYSMLILSVQGALVGFLEDDPTGPSDNSFFDRGILHLQLYSFLSPLASNCPSFCLWVIASPGILVENIQHDTGLAILSCPRVVHRNPHSSLLCCCQTYRELPVQPCLFFSYFSLYSHSHSCSLPLCHFKADLQHHVSYQFSCFQSPEDTCLPLKVGVLKSRLTQLKAGMKQPPKMEKDHKV